MRKIVKEFFLVDKNDKEYIYEQLFEKNLLLKDIAKSLGVTSGFVSNVVNGRTYVTQKVINQFKSVGISLSKEFDF